MNIYNTVLKDINTLGRWSVKFILVIAIIKILFKEDSCRVFLYFRVAGVYAI